MEPDYRAFACVELPFRLLPSRTVRTTPVSAPAGHVNSTVSTAAVAVEGPAASPREAQAVAAFLPPASLHAVLQKASALSADGVGEAGDQQGDDETRAGARHTHSSKLGDSAEGEASQAEQDVGEEGPNGQRVGRTRRRAQGRAGKTTTSSAVQADVEEARARDNDPETKAADEGSRLQSVYHIRAVSRRSVSTRWESHSADRQTSHGGNSGTVGSSGPQLWSYAGDPDDVASRAAWEADRHRAVFPSVEPQLIQEGYLRNDLLLRVVRRKRVRRVRDAVTGAILHEEVLPDTHEDKDDAPPIPRLETKVMGVVSRELLLRRPADFAFAMVTPEEATRAPAVHHPDIFAPGCFLSHRTPFTVGYVPGREVNTSVLAHQAHLARLGHVDPVQRMLLAETGFTDKHAADTSHGHSDGGAPRSLAESGGGGGGLIVEDRVVRTLYADPSDVDNFPPAQTTAQQEQLRLLGSSVDGSCPDTDPPEVRTLMQLLTVRPLWSMRDLCDAMLRSGQCPVDYTNRCVIHALTYVVVQGPFNRLRIRLGYDPFRHAALNVRYQIVTVRVMRRSDLGVLLRDVSRSPHIADALQVVRHRHKTTQASYQSAHAGEYRGTLLERCCLIIEHGALNLFAQFIDLLDDPEIANVVESTPDHPLLPVERRLDRAGWLTSDAQYVRIATHIVDRLDRMLREEVLPLIQMYEGSANPSTTAATSTSPSLVAGAGARAARATRSPHSSDDGDDRQGAGDDSELGTSGSEVVSDGSDDRDSLSVSPGDESDESRSNDAEDDGMSD